MLMFGKNGNPLFVKDDETLKTFSPEAYAEFGGESSIEELAFYFYQTDGHWYMTSDSGRKYQMDNYPLDQGRGYIVFTGAALQKGATLTDSGAVAQGDLPIALPKSTFFLSGNAMPSDFKLKEFKAVSGNTIKLSSANFKLLFFGKDGNMQLVKDNERLAAFCPEAYAEFGGEGSIEEFALYFYQSDSHWYMTSDTARKYVMDDYVIQAGEGFTVFCGAALAKGATFTVPAAIEASAAE